MDIKEFRAGEKAYILGDRGTRAEPGALEVTVTKIGRKYVTVQRYKTGYEMQFSDRGLGEPYLVEKTIFGAASILFPSFEAVKDHLEKQDLERWLRSATDWSIIGKYSLEQLRAVKSILTGKEAQNGTEKLHQHG